MSVTIKEIAELANVSRGTVDKVLHNRPGIKEETKNKVLRIAKELNYQPSLAGKALVQTKTPMKFGIMLTGDFNPYIQALMKGIERGRQEFEPFGIEIITRMFMTFEPSEQLAIIQDMVNQKVTGLAVYPIDNSQVINKINQLIESNIAVITFNSPINELNSMCFIGQDHYKGGRTAAELFGKILPSPKNIGVIISTNHLSCHQNRFKGFSDKLKESDRNATILEVQENGDRKEDAFRITLEYCNKYPDMNAIYITGGGVDGVATALDIAGKQKEIHLICHDLTPASRELLKKDVIDFVLDQNPLEQGYQLVKVLFEYCMKKIVPPSQIEIPIGIFTKESL